jgi:hypothetical protein
MTTRTNSQHNKLYTALIREPVDRWYLRDLNWQALTPEQRQSVHRQAIIGWLQTLLLAIVLIQVIFAGLLRALPPDLRASLSFLHRIEWGAYLGIALIAAQVAVGWTSRVVLTNRFYAPAWRIGRPQVIAGKAARNMQVVYLILIILIGAAIVWVRLHGFIFQPAS